MLKGRILAVDWGEKKIGLSLSDPFNNYAILIEPLENKKNDVFNNFYSLIIEKSIKIIVFGIPDFLNGKESSISKKIKEFIFELDKYLYEKGIRELKIETINESYSTIDAYNYFEDRFSKIKNKKSEIKKQKDFKKIKDSLAAKVILENYLIKYKYSKKN